MTFALTAVVLALLWAAVTDTFTLPNILLGGVIGFGALWILRNRISGPGLFRKAWRALLLAMLFLYELWLSGIRVAILVLRPSMRAHLKPGIIAFPLTVKSDAEITLLANLMTLTPGTLSMDVSEDRKYLYVHAVSVTDKEALINEIAAGFEKRIAEVFE